jgi:hypothetical protein
MMKTGLFAAMLLVVAQGSATAGGQSGSLGVGAEFQLNGAGGASLSYDAGDFHAGGFLGFFDPGGNQDSTFQFGGRFYYHIHSTAMSDFGVGGSLGVVSFPNAMNERQTGIYVEPGVQIRLFLASNVALSASTGVVIGTSDADGVAITGSAVGFVGGVGLHYYFF